jgi:hypothetical protein
MTITKIRLSQSIFVPGVSMRKIDTVLDRITCPDFEGELKPQGVLCRGYGEMFLIPYTHIQCVLFEKESLNVKKVG